MNYVMYSPTVCFSYKINEDWWKENGGGSIYNPRNLDHQGYDEYGYDSSGRDRAYNSQKDYEKHADLYQQTKKDYSFYIRNIE